MAPVSHVKSNCTHEPRHRGGLGTLPAVLVAMAILIPTPKAWAQG